MRGQPHCEGSSTCAAKRDGDVADIFISYTSSDRDWARWIVKELEALGHTSHVHESEIKGGGDIYSADHVLCVVSDEYLKGTVLDP
jgi:hypothetical protein